jgi:hypothetical protein
MKIGAALFMIISFCACSKILIKPNDANTGITCFNQIKNDLKNKYVFFDYKKVKWDSITSYYENRITKDMDETVLFTELSNMLASLRDGHVSLYAPIDTFRYLFYNGTLDNFNEGFVNSQYLIPNNAVTAGAIKHCLLSNEVGYIYYSSFKNEITLSNMNEVLNTYATTKGLIVDLRNNTGGSNDNIYRLMEHFVSEPKLVGLAQEKLSNANNDFSKPFEISIKPKGVLYNKPIVILTNSRIYSSANIFCGFMSQLSNVKLIGDKTGGGTGVPSSNQLPNGWLYRFSSSFVTLADGAQFENGIAPDINISTSAMDELNGKDALIEKAILELK